MKRATVLGVAFAAALRAPAAAQQAGKTYRVGILVRSTPSATAVNKDTFVHAMSGLGYREGQNLELLVRSTGGDLTRAAALASELVRLKPDVIVASSPPSVAAIKRATASIPIVMLNVTDPVLLGFVASIARPGGNITGAASIAADLEGKRLQLLTELMPNLRRVAFVEDPNNPGSLAEAQQYRVACRQLGIASLAVDIGSPTEIDGVLRSLPQKHADAVVVANDAVLAGYARRIVELIAAQRLPAVYGLSDYPAVGGLISYGPSNLAQWALAATYVDRILKGAKPADLPVQQPRTFELAVNLKTAKALGITVPQSILLQATQVIR